MAAARVDRGANRRHGHESAPSGAPADARRASASGEPGPGSAPVHRIDADRHARAAAAERRIAAVARVLDDLVEVPGTGRRVGLEPLLGLIPIGGDLLGALANGWVVLEAARFRLPRVVLARMVVNVVADLLLGAVPVLGDLVDFGFKASSRNLELFRRHAREPDADTRSHAAFLAGLLLTAVGVAWIVLVLLSRVLGELTLAL